MIVTVGQLVYDKVLGTGNVVSVAPGGDFTAEYVGGKRFQYDVNGVMTIFGVQTCFTTPFLTYNFDNAPSWVQPLFQLLANEYNVTPL